MSERRPATRPMTRIIARTSRRLRLSQSQRGLGLVGGLAVLVMIGTVLLLLPVSGAGRALTWNEALFTAVSAVATTGMTIITPGVDLSLFGQVVLLVLMQLGGVGFMVAAVAVFRLIGKRVTFAERLTLRDSLGLLSAGQILSLTSRILAAVLFIEALGAVVLWLVWWPQYGPAWAAYFAIFHSVSAFTNASFDLFAGSPTAAAGFPTDALTLLTLAALIFLGGIGIPVIADLLRYPRRRFVSLHTRITLITAASLILVGTILFYLTESRGGSVFGDESAGRLWLLSFFHAVASRTSGFVVSAQFSQLAPANGLLLTILMFIGASPASMGGGITTSAFAVLVLAVWNFARGRSEIRAGRRTIPLEILFKAAAVATAAAAVIALVTWLLLYTQENVTLVTALVETVSAFSTSGFSLGLTPRLNLFGQLLIAGLMFFGRAGTLTLIVALAQPSPAPAVGYPEERILIG
ncbi:MAG: potassium transporter [Candidatus Promineofilum sp.]|nr:potassium transporter [Promineifilum sp.]